FDHNALASIIYFFFQAEDGIRDFHVTGVQTCALPISSRLLSYQSGPVRPWDDLLGLRGLAPGVGRYCLARPPGCLSHGFGRLRRARLRACAALPSAEDFFLWHGAHAALRLSSRWSSPAWMWSTSLARPTQRSG